MPDPPLLVFGPRSLDYDFGPSHPLTPRRFGPGMDLLRAVGAEPGLAPEPATDDELLTVHRPVYLDVVKRFSEDSGGWLEPEAGLGAGDNPPFHGMHDAAAAVAGGSLRAMEAILRGEVAHAFHPGGGLHHAMPARASGFCIYDDPALAIARARRDGLRVLYVDLDVHHGDGVEAIHAADPGVLTLSFHESGRYLFPGTGFSDDLGDGVAAGSIVNVPLEPETGEEAWLEAVRTLLPELAASFAPDVIVSQHGSDPHGWDPLAHLRVTTTAMGEAARLIDAVAHRWAGGRWLATGGGGYGVYDVVPRAWTHVWLAGAHEEPPNRLPAEWRDRWALEAARHGVHSLPRTLDDLPNLGEPPTAARAVADAASRATASLVRRATVPALIREAIERGWWRPLDDPVGEAARSPTAAPAGSVGAHAIVTRPHTSLVGRLEVEPRIVAGLSPGDLRGLLLAAMATDDLRLTLAVDGSRLLGLVASAQVAEHAERAERAGLGEHSLLAVGVTPAARRRGIARSMLAAHVEAVAPSHGPLAAECAIGERDPIEPLDRAMRTAIARRLLDGAGFTVGRPPGMIGQVDPGAVAGRRG